MNLNYFSKYKGEVETLSLLRNPLYYGLGYYTDDKGKQWDINAVFGGEKPYVCARPVDLSPYYSTDVTSHPYGHHIWKPYYFNIIS